MAAARDLLLRGQAVPTKAVAGVVYDHGGVSSFANERTVVQRVGPGKSRLAHASIADTLSQPKQQVAVLESKSARCPAPWRARGGLPANPRRHACLRVAPAAIRAASSPPSGGTGAR